MAIYTFDPQIKYFFLSFLLSSILTPIVIYFSRKASLVALPRPDRWHKSPTALYGGVALFFSFIIPFFLFNIAFSKQYILLLIGSTLFFLIGLLDDIFEFSPQEKFLAQLVSIVAIVGFGLKINLSNFPILSICLSVFWLIALTNAVNILDNMDGLSSGIAIVASISLAIYGYMFNINQLIIPSFLLAGSCLGFFLYNFKPAKIFMGDCGSLFLGFSLGALSILSTNYPSKISISNGLYGSISNIILMLTIPVAVLIIPIFDTAFVSFNRLKEGRSIAQGGRDHTSHRLVLLGLSEERAVLTLMLTSATISALTLYMAKNSMYGLLAVFSVTAIFSLFFGVFLSYLNKDIYVNLSRSADLNSQYSKISSVLESILNKKQILQVCVDLILLTIAYYSAYLLKFDGYIDEFNKELITKSLPLVLGVKLCCMWLFGLYRGQWRFASLDDTFKIIKAVFLSSFIIISILVFSNRFQGYSRVVFFLDAIITFLLIGGVRFLLRMFNEYFIRQAEKKHSIPILLFGAGDGGDLFLRELRKRKGHDYLPVGFIDDDKAKLGQEIHGVKVLGTRRDIEAIIKRYGVKIVFISILSEPSSAFEDLFKVCRKLGVKCIRMRPLVSFDRLEDGKDIDTKVLTLKKKKKFIRGS